MVVNYKEMKTLRSVLYDAFRYPIVSYNDSNIGLLWHNLPLKWHDPNIHLGWPKSTEDVWVNVCVIFGHFNIGKL